MSQSNPYYQRYPRDEWADTGFLNCEEYGALQRLRDFSWHHEGIPDDAAFFLKRLPGVLNISRYKLKKLWPVLENFFTLRDGFFYYESDESKRLKLVEITSKRRTAGKLGALSRWSDVRSAEAEADGKRMANAIPVAMDLEWQTDGIPEPEPYTPEGSSSSSGVVGSSPPAEEAEAPPGERSEQNQQLAETGVEFHQAVSNHCAKLGLKIPNAELTAKLRKKFPELPSGALIRHLPRFPGQESPGLWLRYSLDDLAAEAARQSQGLRKPSGKEHLIAEARAIDEEVRKRKTSGGA